MTCKQYYAATAFSDNFIVDKQKQSNAKDFHDNLNRFNISSLKSISPSKQCICQQEMICSYDTLSGYLLISKDYSNASNLLSQIYQYIIISK